MITSFAISENLVWIGIGAIVIAAIIISLILLRIVNGVSKKKGLAGLATALIIIGVVSLLVSAQ